MNRTLLGILSLMLVASISIAQPRHSLQLDDGLGHRSLIVSSNPAGIFTLPGTPGEILTFIPGVSPAWLCGGNTGPVSTIIGTLSLTDLVIQTSGTTRATFSNTPSSTTAMLTMATPTPNTQGVRINGTLDATGTSTLAADPGVWDLAVDGDEVVSGVFKTGGSLWFDGNSSTHTITADKPLNIKTSTNDSVMIGTNGATRMTIAKNGFIGIGTANPVSQFQVTGTPADPTFKNSQNLYTPDPFNHVLTVENLATNAKGNGIAIIIHNPSGILLPHQANSDGHFNNNESNYMTFYNGNGDHDHIKGRIEGFSYENYEQLKAQIDQIQNNTDIYNPFSYFTFNVGYNSDWFTYNSDFIQFTPPTLPTLNTGTLPSINFCDLDLGFTIPDVPWICYDDVTGIPYPCLHDVFVGGTISYPCGFSGGSWPSLTGGSIGSLSVSSPFSINGSPLTNLTNPFSVNYAFINEIASQVRDLPYKEKAAMILTNKIGAAVNFGSSFLGGVTYESGSGDYAEWLERADHNEKVTIGDVVGVSGGKITKNTEGADRCMVVSWKPCVLGNMPEEGKEQDYNKVAFMGQIPVKVACTVHKGDYLIPDGHNNGFAKAISPNDITSGDLGKVFGVAWEDAPEVGVKFVKIAVGLKPHEMVKIIQDQEREIADLQNQLSEIDMVKAQIAEIKSSLHPAKMAKHSKKKSKHNNQLTSN